MANHLFDGPARVPVTGDDVRVDASPLARPRSARHGQTSRILPFSSPGSSLVSCAAP